MAEQEAGRGERYVVIGVGGFGTFDDYDEARQFAEREAERMGLDPIARNGAVPLFTVSDTEYFKASEDPTP